MASPAPHDNTVTVASSLFEPKSIPTADATKEEQAAEAQTQTPMVIRGMQSQDASALPSGVETSSQRQAEPLDTKASSALASSTPQEVSATSISASDLPPVAPIPTRKQSEALGPATEGPIAPPLATVAAGPTLSISLMLTTGARHPYKIDEKYLAARKVHARTADGAFDPRELSGYQLKELIWIDWRSEWDPRPVSPSSIRLIILGRMIEDKASLRDFPFNLSSVNVVHMTVKPADLLDDEETAGKGAKGSTFRSRDDGESGAGCRCVIL